MESIYKNKTCVVTLIENLDDDFNNNNEDRLQIRDFKTFSVIKK